MPQPLRRQTAAPWWAVVSPVLLAGLLVAAAAPAAAQTPAAGTRFADPAFAQIWAASDAAVAGEATSRSWTWGPAPIAAAEEPYGEAPGGERLVQYFDKSRMEITAPTADRGQRWFVTNGLLTKELVAGQVQIGDDQFVAADPARIPVAGDPGSPDAPSYAVFRGTTTIAGDNRAPDRTGELLDQAMNSGGRVRTIKPREDDDDYRFARYEPATGHNILAAFWGFMTAVPGTDWLFALGYPISEPYWVRVNLQGQPRDVVVQLFERRVLTLTPTNRAEWRVEMGNIGQHYYRWRYGSTTPAPLVTMEPATPGLPLRVRGFNWRPETALRVAVAKYGDGSVSPDAVPVTTDASGAFETTLNWDPLVAVLYAEAGINLEVWAGRPDGEQATTPLQVGNQLAEGVEGQVVGVDRSARLVRVLLESGVIRRVALTDETEVRRADESRGSFADVNTGVRIVARGQPSGSGVLLADLIRLRRSP